MKTAELFLLVCFALIGAFLLGKGITGYVALGSSCCFPPNCPVENICDAAEPILESPSAVGNGMQTIAGALLVVVATVMFLRKRG